MVAVAPTLAVVRDVGKGVNLGIASPMLAVLVGKHAL